MRRSFIFRIIVSNSNFPYNEYQTVESMEKVRKVGKGGKFQAQNLNPNLTSFSLSKMAKGANFNTQQGGLGGGLKLKVLGRKQRGLQVKGKLAQKYDPGESKRLFGLCSPVFRSVCHDGEEK